MWRYDFHLFYLAGQAVLKDTSPYLIPDFNPPYLLAMLFAPLALLPENWAYLLFVGLQLALLWRALGRRAVWALLSFPVWFDLFVGQVDLFLGLLSGAMGIWVLPLLLAKPQLGFVFIPWILRTNREKRSLWLKVALLSVSFVGLSFLLRPTWFAEWQAAVPSVAEYSCRDANFYWLIPPLYKKSALVLGMSLALLLTFSPWVKDRRTSWSLLHLFAPLTNIYSASVLFEWMGPLEILLSWVAILWVGDIHHGAPMFLVALSILFNFQARFSLLFRRPYAGRTGTHP